MITHYVIYDETGGILIYGNAINLAPIKAQAAEMNARVLVCDEIELDPACHRVEAGVLVVVKPDPQALDDAAWEAVKFERNRRLDAADVALAKARDAALLAGTAFNELAWAEYRRALRDLPVDQSDPLNINWPVMPV